MPGGGASPIGNENPRAICLPSGEKASVVKVLVKENLCGKAFPVLASQTTSVGAGNVCSVAAGEVGRNGARDGCRTVASLAPSPLNASCWTRPPLRFGRNTSTVF